jgi:hypothetical protein
MNWTWKMDNPDVAKQIQAATVYMEGVNTQIDRNVHESEGCAILETLMKAQHHIQKAIDTYLESNS